MIDAFQIAELVSLVALLFAIWRASQWPGWQIRTIIYGWAAIVVYALFWSILLPMTLKGTMAPAVETKAFPDGTIAAGALFGGWFYPFIVVVISDYLARRKR